MTTLTIKKINKSVDTKESLLLRILNEVQELRDEMYDLFSGDSLDNYEHPKRIKQSYTNALQRHPRRSSSKHS